MAEEYDALCSKSPGNKLHVNINGEHEEGSIEDIIEYLLKHGVKTIYFGSGFTQNKAMPLKNAGIKVKW